MKRYLILISLIGIISFYPFNLGAELISEEEFKDCGNCHRDPAIKEKLNFPGQFEKIHEHLARESFSSAKFKKSEDLEEKKEKKKEPLKKELINLESSFLAGDNYIELNWRVPLKFTRVKEKIIGYRIRYGKESGFYEKRIDVGKVNQYRLTGLEKDISYFILVQAYTKDKEVIGAAKEIGPVYLPQAYIMSSLEREIAGKISPEISLELRQFGYNLFANKENSFTAPENIPVGPDYILGAGDSLIINVWGSTEINYLAKVDREGRINLPKIGTISVWGMTYEQVKSLIYDKLSQIISNFKLSLSLGKLRSIKVFVIGEVQKPGSYELSSLSTAISALFAARGPSKKGSMRNIKVFRNNKLLRSLDLYRFLIKGDKSEDLRLESGDTIFVPIIGPIAAIAGNVRRPAIYEIREHSSLKDLLNLAGGSTARGYLNRLQIERASGHEKNILLDINLGDFYEKGDNSQNIALKDRDIVKVFSIYPLSENFIELKGNIQYPGRYELKPGMRIADLISLGGRLLPETYLERAEIERILLPDKQKKIIPFDLGKLLKGDSKEDIALRPWDRVNIYTIWDFKRKPTVKIEGKIIKPDTYELFTDMRISDLIFRAGGLEASAYLLEAELTRIERDGQGSVYSRIIPVNLEKILRERDKKEDLLLKENDYLLIKELSEWRYLQGTVTLKGEFRFPGKYPIRRGERLSSIIERSKNYTRDAFLKGAIFSREAIREKEKKLLQKFILTQEEEISKQEAALIGAAISAEELKRFQESAKQRRESLKLIAQQKTLGRILINLEEIEKIKGTDQDIVLEDGDELFVPKIPSAISVFGEVYNPGNLLFKEGKELSYYLNRVGGLKKSADAEEIYIIKADGSVISSFNKKTIAGQKGYLLADYSLHSLKIERGDTIFIPEKFVEKIRWWQVTKESVDVLYKVALGIAAFNFMFK